MHPKQAPKSDEDLWDSPSFDSAGSPSPHASWGDAQSGGKDGSVDNRQRSFSMDAVMSPTEGVRLRREPAAKSDECTWLHSQLAQKNDELAESRQKLAELRETSELTIKTEKEKREKMEKQLDELQETIWAGENAAVLKRQIENLQEMLWQMDPLLAKEQAIPASCLDTCERAMPCPVLTKRMVLPDKSVRHSRQNYCAP